MLTDIVKGHPKFILKGKNFGAQFVFSYSQSNNYKDRGEDDMDMVSHQELEKRATKKAISPDCTGCSFSCTQFMINPIKVRSKKNINEKIKEGEIVHVVGFQNRRLVFMVLIQEDDSWNIGYDFEFVLT